MARPSISVVLNSAPQVDTSGFSEQALEWGWNTMTQDLCNALAKVLSLAKNVNDFERADARNTSYTHLYGAEDVCPNLSVATRRTKHDTTSTSAYYKTYYTGSEGFYLAGLQLATNMYGLTTGTDGDLPTTDIYPSTLSSYNSSTDQYSRIIAYLENFGLTIHSGWKIDQYLTDIAYNEDVTINDENSFYDGTTIKKTSSSSSTTYGLGNGFQIFRTLYHIVGHFHILRRIAELTPTTRGGRGGTAFNPSATPRASQIMFSRQCLPHELVIIRQALSEVHSYLRANGYDPYSPGTATTSISSGRIRNRIKKALSNRGITFASAEIADKTHDITKGGYSLASAINDPLIIAAAGFACVETNDTVGTNGFWGALVPAVHLCRKYLMRAAMVAYDYKEADNPNAFEAAGGKVEYFKSNMYVFLNSRASSYYNWKINTHDYDAYWSGNQYPYLQHLSSVLRCNIAKTALGVNRGQKLTDLTNGYVTFRNQWAFLPSMKMFGTPNKLSSRRFNSNAVVFGIDGGEYTDGDGDVYCDAPGYEADLNGDSVALEEPEAWNDLIENSWELGARAYKFMVNPECSDASTARTELYIPSSTPANTTTDSRDTSIPNRIACWHLGKVDGTATSNSYGWSSPYNYNPFTPAFALIPFYTSETDNTYKDYTTEPWSDYGLSQSVDDL